MPVKNSLKIETLGLMAFHSLTLRAIHLIAVLFQAQERHHFLETFRLRYIIKDKTEVS